MMSEKVYGEIRDRIQLAHANSTLRALELSLLFLNFQRCDAILSKEDRKRIVVAYFVELGKRVESGKANGISRRQYREIIGKYSGGCTS